MLNSGELNGKQIRRSFGNLATEWLRESFESLDDALDNVTFKEVTENMPADIVAGWTQILQLDYVSLFSVSTAGEFRSKGTLEFRDQASFLVVKENFMQAAQSDIGHILGMGYITPSENFVSIAEWPFQGPYGQNPLGEFDVALLRAIYGESTCISSFAEKIQNKINKDAIEKIELKLKLEEQARVKAQLEADARAREELYWISVGKAQAEAEFKAKLEREARAAAEAKKKLEAQARAKLEATKKITITCTKGKLTKKVAGTNPNCPVGYKKA